MKHLHTEIQIEADPAEVWAVLTDFDRYPDWNPFIVDVRGDAEPGERLRVTLSPPGGRRITMRPTVTDAGARSGLRVVGAPRRPRHLRRPAPVRAERAAAPAPGSSSGRPSPGCWCRSWPRAWTARPLRASR